MFCDNCGAQLGKNADFCPACGQKIKPVKKKNTKKVLLILGAVVLALLLVALVLNLTGVGETLWDRTDSHSSGRKDKPSKADKDDTSDEGKDETPDENKESAKDETPQNTETVGDINSKSNYTVANEEAESKKDVVVATLGNQTLTNGELQAYYWSTVYDFINYYGDYISLTGLDLTKPLNEQYYDDTGKTYQQWFLEMALDNWHQYATLKQMAVDAGYDFGADYTSYMNSVKEQLETLKLQYGYTDMEKFLDEQFYPGTSYELYLKYTELDYTASTYYYEGLYKTVTPTPEDLEAYYVTHLTEFVEKGMDKSAGNYYDVRHILIGIEGNADSDGNYSDAQWAECLRSAQDMLQRFLDGDATENAFAELAKQYSQDPGSAENGGLYSNLTKDYGFIENFENWYLDESRKPGDTGIVQNTQSSVQGYHIMYFSGSAPIWEREAETAIIGEYTDGKIAEAQEKYALGIDYKKIVLSTVDLTGA